MDKHLCTRCGSGKLSYKGDPTKKQDYLQCDVCWTEYPRDLISEEFISLGSEHATLLFNQYMESERYRQEQQNSNRSCLHCGSKALKLCADTSNKYSNDELLQCTCCLTVINFTEADKWEAEKTQTKYIPQILDATQLKEIAAIEKAINEAKRQESLKPTLRETLENITTMLGDIQSQLNTLEFRLDRLTSPSTTSVVSTHSDNYAQQLPYPLAYPLNTTNTPYRSIDIKKICPLGGRADEVAFDANGKPIIPHNTKKI